MGYKIGLAEKRKKLLEEELKKILPYVIKGDVEKVILFGSLAKEKVNKKSDLDLIIIKKTKKKYMDRLDEIYSSIKSSIAVDLFVYTPSEFEEMSKKNIFIKSVLKYGKILYERK
ncbi:MAG: nucleotidyltransferase domain-containing protein [bacterium]|nr:nucleotidyltransferase domain-containing protein [bacterium]MDW8164437.1 nucleotidyltransferase domain-containing protein [Candidatus Omnitrophota bacterium]